MAPFDVALVLEAMAQLDRDVTVALGHADVLVAHGYPAANALAAIREALDDVATVLHALRTKVLSEATSELDMHVDIALRTRLAAIVVQIAELRRVEHEVVHCTRELFVGRFRSVADVAVYLLTTIAEINEARLVARFAVADDEDIRYRAHRYREALDRADRAFAAIGHDPDLARFLATGSWVRSQAFRITCRTIAMLLDVPIGRASCEEYAS